MAIPGTNNTPAPRPVKKTGNFATLQPAKPDITFVQFGAVLADPDPRKVNLVIGAYRDDQEKPWKLPSVTEAKKQLNINDSTHEYLPLRGNAVFLDAAQALVFGDEIINSSKERIASVQSISGTGANSAVAMMCEKTVRPGHIWLPDPTWVNHFDIWAHNAPSVEQATYPYYDTNKSIFDFEGTMRTLRNDVQEHDAILFHSCAHNPTGMDPSKEQWKALAQICREKKLFVIFDSAYQGFATGDLDNDAWAIRYFCTTCPDLDIAVCQSFSKNMGLYGERTGALHVVVAQNSSPATAKLVHDQAVSLQRAIFSMAPSFGSRIAETVLTSAELRKVWQQDLLTMSGRIQEMRQVLYDELKRLQTPGRWECLIEQTGMFSYTGLSPDQIVRLQRDHHIYMLPSGRASICGLTSANAKYVAQAIHSVVTTSA